jgi:RNA polymerase sigma factor (sigma-70 family)
MFRVEGVYLVKVGNSRIILEDFSTFLKTCCMRRRLDGLLYSKREVKEPSMATSSLGPLMRHLRKILSPAHSSNVGDGELLARFVQQRDEAAFELLVWRHQRMVLGVCRRVLGHAQDAEDAFQATFLTLARKADSLRRHRAVAAWLHKVAYHIALRARKNAAKRKTTDLDMAHLVSVSGPEDEAMRRDVAAVLDEEVNRLPEKYRLPVVLCYLEGKTYQEVGRQLGVPVGTLSARLTRARELLRTRLLRRGVVVSSAGLTAALLLDALANAGMIPLIGSLIRAAGAVAGGGGAPVGLMSARTLALTEGMLRMMFMTKVKIVLAASLVVTVAAAGLATLSHTTRAADKPVALAEEPRTEAPARLSAKPRKETPRVQDDTPDQKDGIAWGTAAHGLQAGITFRPGDQTTYEVGQSVTFVVALRNVSDKTIQVSHIEPLFDENPPQVKDAKGRQLGVGTGPINSGDVPIVQRSLEAGQQITLGHPWFRIREMGWRGEVLGPTCWGEPGHYKVGYRGFPLRLHDGQDIFLGTKTVELDIRKAQREREGSRQSVDPLKSSSRDGEGKMPLRVMPMALEAMNLADFPRLYYVSARSFNIPVQFDTNRAEQIDEVILFASTDEGKTYEQIDKQPATAKRFFFTAPRDGMYWLLIQEVDKQGRCKPARLGHMPPVLRVCVDTKPPSIQITVKGYRSKASLAVELNVFCKVIDANLDEDSVALETSFQREGPWESLGKMKPNKEGELFLPMRWGKNSPERIHLRLRAKDKAGNVTIDTQSIEIKELPEPEQRLKPTGG